MSDRIDSMSEAELREWARGLRACCESLSEYHITYPEEIENHLKLIRPTPIDRLREFVVSEGWETFAGKCPRHTYISIAGNLYVHPEWK